VDRKNDRYAGVFNSRGKDNVSPRGMEQDGVVGSGGQYSFDLLSGLPDRPGFSKVHGVQLE
jgi:hypothetical protein